MDILSLNEFVFEGEILPTKFVDSSQVTSGVACAVYSFENDTNKDLGIISIEPGKKTPVQRVIRGEKTIEGILDGFGILYVKRLNGSIEEYKRENVEDKLFTVELNIGDIMQWQADVISNITAFEVCIPPYEDGRYENLPVGNIKDIDLNLLVCFK